MTVGDPWQFARDDLDRLRAAGLYRTRRTFEHRSGRRIIVDGRECLDFASNDYLGLMRPLDVTAMAGAGSSALVTGRSAAMDRLESELAAFEGTEAALVFPTGYAANLGTAAAITGPGDTVFADKLNHSCLIEGARLSGATLKVYRSDRLDRLRTELRKATGRRVIQTDGVFSMDGTLAPLPQLLALADEFDAILMVDEAHATGVFGTCGRGSCEHMDVDSPRLLRTGTMSKALGTLGGFVTGSAEVIDWLRHNARTQMFSTALPPVLCKQAKQSLRWIRTDEGAAARKSLLSRSDALRQSLRSQGWTVPQSIGPIVPVIVGDPAAAVGTATELEEADLIVGCIRPPTVPRGTSRLRISLSHAHSADDVAALVRAMASLQSRS